MPTLDSATRDRIVAAATDLIMERGYEKTTMRAIAERADVSLGSAYYYFGGKEELVQGFYLAIARKHHELVQDRISGVTSFGTRLAACFEAFLDACDEYRSISDSLLSLAIVPTSPLSPFSAQSRAARNQFLRTFEELVEGSDLKTDARLREELPEILWIMQMLVVLGWVQDLSAGQRLTRTIVKRLVPSLARLLSAARLAPFRPFVTDALDSLAMVRQRQYDPARVADVAATT